MNPWPPARSNCGVGVVVDLHGRKSHQLVEDALRVLVNLDHRGARGAEENTGDGSGILLQKPHGFFREEIPGLGDFDSYGVGQAFLPRDRDEQRTARDVVEDVIEREGFRLIAWRDVPTDNTDLGALALDTEPVVKQFFVAPREAKAPVELDAKLYILRRQITRTVNKASPRRNGPFYVCSLHRRKIVYKGMLTSGQLEPYYPELSDPRIESSLAIVHSRFSTNTLGAWVLAHPYRCLAHNGEFNTLRGNVNNMIKREPELACPRFGEEVDKIKPIVSEGVSDSAVADNVLELLLEAGIDLPKALRMLVPEAWEKDAAMPERTKAFYDFFSNVLEPWDGPALVVASDGSQVGAVLDRNGLRPFRYCVTTDGRLVMASEAGVLDIPPRQIVQSGRLKPGQLFLADGSGGGIVPEEEIFASLAVERYGEWLRANRLKLADHAAAMTDSSSLPTIGEDVARYQRSFGYTSEDLRVMLEPMAREGKDPLGAMGRDIPPAVLSARSKPLFNYFHQLFAQVSNPPIDYMRESIVTSLRTHIGPERNLLAETPDHCRRVLVESPILDVNEMAAIPNLGDHGFATRWIDMTYDRGTALATAVARFRAAAAEAIDDGSQILILSDRQVGAERLAIPSLLAVSALHHDLIRSGRRPRVGIVVDSGEPRLTHHFCLLLGYGADAIHPWLAYRTISKLIGDGGAEPEDAHTRYRNAIENGILKTMSRMGISTIDSYKGAQVFETIGLDYDFVEEYFERTNAFIPGVGIEEIERGLVALHEYAFGESTSGDIRLEQGGDFYWRRDGELHQWNPFVIGKLQHASRTGDYEAYKSFAAYLNDQDERLQTLRGLLELDVDKKRSIPLEEVEPAENIMRRFSSGSMSFGALSLEAHEAVAAGINRIGGKSGSGEGGEQTDRFGTERQCSMKQVASGRFGVTIDYLAHASEIEIKMAQGSKPGEGGELPGQKVDEGIASVRFTTPGVGLISPPPHHDIYSIEDLAQLIHDLKCANPSAEIHVKLVAVGGVGTIAAGVAKARADAVLISGESGGTGASLKTSIMFAGSPWELGLAETQRVLLATKLRSRIRVRADGGFKTGRDVVIAALLGAEEYGFGTALLVALGCIMLRKCHVNTCSVGVATQDRTLRARFAGKVEHVVTYMRFVAEEVRELMADLGFRTMDEMIGRCDRLRCKTAVHPRGLSPDASQLLHREVSDDAPRKTREQDHGLEKKLDHVLIERAAAAIERKQPLWIETRVTNRDRTVGTMLSSIVARSHGGNTLPDDTIAIRCHGSAGQSFGAFLAKGISLYLEGEANDYVGKGLSGGRIVVRTPAEAGFEAHENIVIGNVALYGATGGEAFFNGCAGERFAVRNSHAISVVEGVGDHACEYMTGGVVVILGRTGKNFAAGMSGGEAYVFDEEDRLASVLNPEMVHTEDVLDERDRELVRRLIESHYVYTHSNRAKRILDDWDNCLPSFVKVIPDTYAAVVQEALQRGNDIRLPLPAPATPAAAS